MFVLCFYYLIPIYLIGCTADRECLTANLNTPICDTNNGSNKGACKGRLHMVVMALCFHCLMHIHLIGCYFNTSKCKAVNSSTPICNTTTGACKGRFKMVDMVSFNVCFYCMLSLSYSYTFDRMSSI